MTEGVFRESTCRIYSNRFSPLRKMGAQVRTLANQGDREQVLRQHRAPYQRRERAVFSASFLQTPATPEVMADIEDWSVREWAKHQIYSSPRRAYSSRMI